MWLLRIIWLLLTVTVVTFLALANIRLYSVGSAAYAPEELGENVVSTLQGIKSALDNGAAYRAENMFKDGYLLSYCFYGLSWVEAAKRVRPGSDLHQRAVEEIKSTIDKLETAETRARFPSGLEPAGGIFYSAWLNRLRGGLLMIQSAEGRDPMIVQHFQEDVKTIADLLMRQRNPVLPRDSKTAFTADNVVAVSTLALHDKLFEPKYKATIDNWLFRIKAHLSEQFELLPSRFDAVTGREELGPRGTSQAYILTFLNDIDPKFGREQYQQFCIFFVEPLWSFPATLELPPKIIATPDDEAAYGTTFLGRSITGTLATLAAAQVNGDRPLADALIQTVEALTVPFEWEGERFALAQQVPFIDAMFLWARTATPWVDTWSNAGLPAILPDWWRLPFHLVSALIAVVMLVILKLTFAPRYRSVPPQPLAIEEDDEPSETVRTHRTLNAIPRIHVAPTEHQPPIVAPSEPPPAPLFGREKLPEIATPQEMSSVPPPLFKRKHDHE